MTTLAQYRGQQAEQAAEAWLNQQGLLSVTRNYRCRYGEIDLIMQDGKCLVFVEVRFREAASHGHALETVTRFKQRKIIKTATDYLITQRLWEKVPCRFDVICPSDETSVFIWIKNAFSVK